MREHRRGNQNGHSRETGNIRHTRQRKTKQKHKIYVLDIINFRGGSRISSWGGAGGALKKIVPSGGRHNFFWGISCEKSRFYAKKSYFFPIVEGGANIFGVFLVKNHDFMPKNHIFSNFRGGTCRVHPLLDPPLNLVH